MAKSNIPPGNYTCLKCRKSLPTRLFSHYKNRKTKDGFRLAINKTCRECTKKDAECRKKAAANATPKPEFGKKCPVCNKPVYSKPDDVPRGVDGTWKWEFDHDKETCEFRGWICKRCNLGLGQLLDNEETIERALHYLRGSLD